MNERYVHALLVFYEYYLFSFSDECRRARVEYNSGKPNAHGTVLVYSIEWSSSIRQQTNYAYCKL